MKPAEHSLPVVDYERRIDVEDEERWMTEVEPAAVMVCSAPVRHRWLWRRIVSLGPDVIRMEWCERNKPEVVTRNKQRNENRRERERYKSLQK